MNNVLKNKKGFTIIEVVLVLAIAGLIFLIVFLALPQLQKSRRDTQRKSDAGRFLASLENWAGNHNGNYPSASAVNAAWMTDNVDGNFNDPSGDPYVIATGATAADAGEIKYYKNTTTGFVCSDTSDVPVAGTGQRDVAVVFKLEQGSFCQDNK